MGRVQVCAAVVDASGCHPQGAPLDATLGSTGGNKVNECPHGVSYAEFCEPCAHTPAEDWVGYPMTVCSWEMVPWPCEYERARRSGVPEEVK
jgi:hypothetical protein